MATQLPTELLIATSNAGKIREFQSLLAALPLRLRSLSEFPAAAEIDETGASFAENATLKAKAHAEQTKLWTLADDSGLEVEALGGAPGVLSARYAGKDASDAERVARLLSELSRAGDRRRTARFVCAIAVADAKGSLVNVSLGVCEGRIADAPRGTNGFGYDPVFIPDGYTQTFGELPPEIKQDISHRARAVKAARSFLLAHLRIKA